MSEALYQLGGLRSWHEREIELREAFQAIAVATVRRVLAEQNTGWQMLRTEGPLLLPRQAISEAYSQDDIFITNHEAMGDRLCLRAETTASSYDYARWLIKQRKAQMPLCIWQVGKSFRRETNDGASAAKLRFNDFWQLEFQCIVPKDMRKDIRLRRMLMDAIALEVQRFTVSEVMFADSDRLPSYSESTVDIEVGYRGKPKEIASCSIRTDFAPDARVVEIAIGLDRIATIAGELQ